MYYNSGALLDHFNFIKPMKKNSKNKKSPTSPKLRGTKEK